MPRHQIPTHWKATGAEVADPRPPSVKWRAWLAEQSLRAGLTADDARVVELAVIERRALPAIARKLGRNKSSVAESKERALNLLSQLPEFWEAARRFERDLLDCARNKDDHDHRPSDMRGVTPDRSSDRFQGAQMVGTGDRRLRQDAESACRLAMQAAG